jgi:histidine ammonia-lyase
MDVAVMLRTERFRNPFFTGARIEEVLPEAGRGFTDYAPVDLQQEVQSLMAPIAPSGSSIVATVEDLQAQTRIKVQRARQAVSTTFDLLGYDLLEGSLWLDARKRQDSRRAFGPAATAAWTAFRLSLPLAPAGVDAPSTPVATALGEFLRSRPASEFYPLDASTLPR